MVTFVDTMGRIADDIDRPDLYTQIKVGINRAISHYTKEPFWFKETVGTFNTVAGQKAYDTSIIPTDIERIHYAEIAINGCYYRLTQRDIRWVEEGNPDDTEGEPSDYAWYQNRIWLYLVPNAIRAIRLYYTKTYADLVADSDTNDWLNYASDLIEARARWWIYTRVIRDPLLAQAAKAEEIEALESMRSKNEDKFADQGVMPSYF